MNISPPHLKVIATILFVAANAMNQAEAQNALPIATAETAFLTPQTPAVTVQFENQFHSINRGHKLIIVTSKAPTVKQTCRFDAATANEIRCHERFHTRPIKYLRADLEAVIEPASSHLYWLAFFVPFAVGGGIITGACFLGAVSAFAIIGAVPIGLIGAFLVLASVVMSRDDYTLTKVLYQKPGTTIAVKLH